MATPTTPIPVRRVRFAYPADLDPRWVRGNPDFSYPANSVSLLMPYAEPYFVGAVRAAIPLLEASGGPEADTGLLARTRAYVAQEAQHAAQHRRFNHAVRRAHPAVARLERWMARTCDWLARTRSLRFNLAFVAGAETMAYALARWTERHTRTLLGGADPVPCTLFLWHLAEEIEHKSAAFDVYLAVDGSRWRYAWASAVALILLGWFVLVGTLVMLHSDRRLLRPLTHLRLLRWAVSAAFEVLPTMAVSALPHHHPDDFADPPLLATWLRGYDPATDTMPLWED